MRTQAKSLVLRHPRKPKPWQRREWMEKITASYDQDSKRYHRFIIKGGQGVVGNIYIPKGEDIPDEIIVSLKTPGEKQHSGLKPNQETR